MIKRDIKNNKSYKISTHALMCVVLLAFIFSVTIISFSSNADAWGTKYRPTCGRPTDGSPYSNCTCEYTCKDGIEQCGKGSDSTCVCQSNKDTEVTIPHITDQFILHRKWLMKAVWEAHVLPSMMLMTEQISAVAMQQMLIIGTFFDARSQLETQLLLQKKQAKAHKNYYVSTGVCQYGTNTRSLAASSRNADLTQIAIAARATQRNLLNGDGISAGGSRDDARSRLAHFKKNYCNEADFGNGMGRLCDVKNPDRINRDIDYTAAMDQENTLELDFSRPAGTNDEADLFALSANLYGHDLLPYIAEDKMALEDGTVIPKGTYAYMKVRSLMAQRSVAHAAFAAQAAMKAKGEKDVAPYMKAILEEMGVSDKESSRIIGKHPSYDKQMQFLTKTLYQTPNFYTDLYESPTNIDRKIVSMQAIGLMNRHDVYRSNLRREAIEAVWLENALGDLEEEVKNKIGKTSADNPILNINGL